MSSTGGAPTTCAPSPCSARHHERHEPAGVPVAPDQRPLEPATGIGSSLSGPPVAPSGSSAYAPRASDSLTPGIFLSAPESASWITVASVPPLSPPRLLPANECSSVTSLPWVLAHVVHREKGGEVGRHRVVAALVQDDRARRDSRLVVAVVRRALQRRLAGDVGVVRAVPPRPRAAPCSGTACRRSWRRRARRAPTSSSRAASVTSSTPRRAGLELLQLHLEVGDARAPSARDAAGEAGGEPRFAAMELKPSTQRRIRATETSSRRRPNLRCEEPPTGHAGDQLFDSFMLALAASRSSSRQPR